MPLGRRTFLGLGLAAVSGVSVHLLLRLFPPFGEAGALGAAVAAAALVALGGAAGDRRVALAAAGLLALAPVFAAPVLAPADRLLRSTVVAALAAGVAAATVRRERSPPFLARLLGEAAARNAVLVLAVGLYVAFRSDLAGAVRHAEVWEWGLGVLVFAYLVSRAKTSLRTGMAPAPWASAAKRHVPDVAPRLDAAYEAWAKAAEGFVERGERAAYEALWRAAFATVARKTETVDKAVDPLVAFEAAPRPRIALPWRMRRVEEEDRRRRLQVHRTLVARLRAARRAAVRRPGRTDGRPRS